MDKSFLLQNIWISLLIWSLLYLGDYFLTIFSARNFQTKLSDHYQFDQSFELNPLFENDVNNLRLISPRHIFLWLLTSVVFYLLWQITHQTSFEPLFYFVYGELVLMEIAVHLRHLRNIAIIKSHSEGAVTGQIRYSYWFGLKLSSWEFLSFFIVYMLFALFEGSWFFAGGATGCLILALRHYRGSKKAQKVAAAG